MFVKKVKSGSGFKYYWAESYRAKGHKYPKQRIIRPLTDEEIRAHLNQREAKPQLTELVEIYNKKRAQFQRHSNNYDKTEADLVALKEELDSMREFDETYVFCYICNRKHKIEKIGGWSVDSDGNPTGRVFVHRYKDHNIVRIPFECLIPEDHVFAVVEKVREEVTEGPFKGDIAVSIIKGCIVCGKRKEKELVATYG